MASDSPSVPPKKRVLVVDDHPFFREGIATWIGRQSDLEYCGYADSPPGAMAAIEHSKPDLILLDLRLRQGDGLDLLRTIKESNLKLRVIVVSQKDETLFAERVLRAGAHGYVPKDEAGETMAAAIRTVLNDGIYVSPSMRRQLFGSSSDDSTLPPDRLRGLYNRELEVLQFLGRGMTTKEIALEMDISPKTVESYRENLKKKLGLSDSLALVRFATLWQQEGNLPE